MASMANIMKQRATTVKATSANRSTEVFKIVPKSEFLILDRHVEPMLRENEKERIASESAAVGLIFGSKY
jgi:hypothetical protein